MTDWYRIDDPEHPAPRGQLLDVLIEGPRSPGTYHMVLPVAPGFLVGGLREFWRDHRITHWRLPPPPEEGK